jgi:hypothetical protein
MRSSIIFVGLLVLVSMIASSVVAFDGPPPPPPPSTSFLSEIQGLPESNEGQCMFPLSYNLTTRLTSESEDGIPICRGRIDIHINQQYAETHHTECFYGDFEWIFMPSYYMNEARRRLLQAGAGFEIVFEFPGDEHGHLPTQVVTHFMCSERLNTEFTPMQVSGLSEESHEMTCLKNSHVISTKLIDSSSGIGIPHAMIKVELSNFNGMMTEDHETNDAGLVSFPYQPSRAGPNLVAFYYQGSPTYIETINGQGFPVSFHDFDLSPTVTHTFDLNPTTGEATIGVSATTIRGPDGNFHEGPMKFTLGTWEIDSNSLNWILNSEPPTCSSAIDTDTGVATCIIIVNKSELGRIEHGNLRLQGDIIPEETECYKYVGSGFDIVNW